MTPRKSFHHFSFANFKVSLRPRCDGTVDMKWLDLDIHHSHLGVKKHNEILVCAADLCESTGSVLIEREEERAALTLLFGVLSGHLAAAAPC